jgi:hypothetical protein
MSSLVGNRWRRNCACDLTQQDGYADSKEVAVQQTEGIPWLHKSSAQHLLTRGECKDHERSLYVKAFSQRVIHWVVNLRREGAE